MSASFKANGNITPSRFCRLDTSADGKVVQSGAGEKCYGVSQEGTRNPPYGALDDGYRAIADENIMLYTENDICWLEAGGTWAVGDRLKADASGKGVATTTENDEIGALALEAASSGGLGKVRVFTDRNV